MRLIIIIPFTWHKKGTFNRTTIRIPEHYSVTLQEMPTYIHRIIMKKEKRLQTEVSLQLKKLLITSTTNLNTDTSHWTMICIRQMFDQLSDHRMLRELFVVLLLLIVHQESPIRTSKRNALRTHILFLLNIHFVVLL